MKVEFIIEDERVSSTFCSTSLHQIGLFQSHEVPTHIYRTVWNMYCRTVLIHELEKKYWQADLTFDHNMYGTKMELQIMVDIIMG